MKRWSPVLLAAALIGCGGAADADHEEASLPAGTIEFTDAQLATAELSIDTVRIEETAVPLLLSGTIDTPESETAHVGSVVSGRVEEVAVLPGARVRAGQLLVRIHSHELATARRDLSSAVGARAAAKAALDRSARLLAAGAVAREEFEQREATSIAAEAEYHRAKEIVDHLHPDGEDATVRAPRDGVVFSVMVNIGDAVLEGAPLVELGDDSNLWVTAWVPEASLSLVTAARTVGVMIDALGGDSLVGRVVGSGGRVDAVRRAAEIRVALVRPPKGVRPGMLATLHLAGGQSAPRAILSAESVQRVSTGTEVYVVDAPNRFRRFPVTDAVTLADGRVAVAGLTAGMVVVTRGAYMVRSMLDAEPAEHD